MFSDFDDERPDEDTMFEASKRAAVALQKCCESLFPEMPTELQPKLLMLFAGVAQLAGVATAWAKARTKQGHDEEEVARAANLALNALAQAAAVAMGFIDEAHVDSCPKFSEN